MKRVYTAAHLPAAQLLVHSLEASGVPARVFNETLQGGVGELPHIYPEVWIEDDRDWNRARELVGEFDQNVTRIKGALRCPHCREDSPDTFEICWRCGAALPALGESDGSEEKEESD